MPLHCRVVTFLNSRTRINVTVPAAGVDAEYLSWLKFERKVRKSGHQVWKMHHTEKPTRLQ